MKYRASSLDAVFGALADPTRRAIAERLRFPERALMVSVPVRMDDGRRVVFHGYRVQHSSILGPTKGGVRYDPEVTLASAQRSRCG